MNIIYSDIIGTSDTEATDFTEVTEGKYSPLIDGRLVQLKLYYSQTAATSVISAATVELTCPLWGVPVYATLQAAGIVTAPAFPPIPGIQNCDLPVKTGVQITAKVRQEAGVTAVTSNLIVEGVFEA